MSKVLFPGSFDPFTNGHLDIVRRAALLFDEVIVGVGTNTFKKYLFSTPEKIELINAAVKEAQINNVSVQALTGLTIDFANEVGAKTIVRGLRNEADYLYERDIADMNARLGQVETIFLMANPANQNISSSMLKEYATFGADISALVPAPVYAAIHAKFTDDHKN
ncbi:MAG: pantetheine-phosphate adenylyltransferase [Lactobacillaceae bacterium]|jgi:pantetheine-phosphate adenylyltransferase|nr:pantetheine-phosphate adenylyltransferase [Lactobacillaceae bacterium]